MRPFVIVAVACVAFHAPAAPLIEVFHEKFFELPDVAALCPNIGDSYETSDFLEFDETYLITLSGGVGDAYLGLDLDLHATGINQSGPDSLGSYARVMFPFDLMTLPPGSGSWQGSGPFNCNSRIDSRCRIPVSFGETFELRIRGEIRHSYAFQRMSADQQPFPLAVLHEYARITLPGHDYVLRQSDTGEWLPVDGALVSATRIEAHSPEPATALPLLAAVAGGWWWKRRKSRR